MPTEELIEKIEDARTGMPSMAVTTKLITAIQAAHPEFDISECRNRAAALASRNAFALDGQGDLLIRPSGLEHARQFAPNLLGAAEPAKLSKVQRAAVREKQLALLLAARKQAKRPASITERLAEAIAADPTLSGARAAPRRAALREKLIREAHDAAGLPLGRLGFDGVNS